MADALAVLVLDDSEIAAEVAKLQLESVGFEVRTASRLADFEALLEEFEPNIILADVQMPEISGDEVCRVLKARFETGSTPIFLFSSLPEAELAERAARAGADGFITKASGPEVLKARLLELQQEVIF